MMNQIWNKFNRRNIARAKNLPFNFTHYLLISKVLLPSVELQPQAGVMYANAEEEVFIPECDLVLDMKVNSNINDQEVRSHAFKKYD